MMTKAASLSPAEEPQSPSSLADYWIGEMIGEGRFGQVFFGRHKSSSLNVAIKVVEKAILGRHPSWLTSLIEEQRLLRKLRGVDGVIQLCASFHDQQCLYLVLECAEGGNLQEILQSQRPDDCRWRSAIEHYSREVVQAVHALHLRNILHCDLKPSNILLTSGGSVRLADFGAAVELSLDGTPDARYASTAALRGTPGYASPEIIRQATNLTYGVDLWSLGCIFCALLVGESPFHAESDALSVDKVVAYVNGGALSVDWSGWSPEWRSLVERLLDVDPQRRMGPSPSRTCGNEIGWHAFLRDSFLFDRPLEITQVLPTTPSWLERATQAELKDGGQGWVAFV